MIKQIKDFYKENKRPPILNDFKNNHQFIKVFGSWKNAMIRAGFETKSKKHKKISDEEGFCS
ncbi:homing endonuclease associated repeat-containing protein [Eubacterium aggregans]|uniref:homing endonuclease associated repeat-containing protein n=1 Tax=Eubacterium aggregans TaxID=81409 RepID=UPI003F40F6B3